MGNPLGINFKETQKYIQDYWRIILIYIVLITTIYNTIANAYFIYITGFDNYVKNCDKTNSRNCRSLSFISYIIN